MFWLIFYEKYNVLVFTRVFSELKKNMNRPTCEFNKKKYKFFGLQRWLIDDWLLGASCLIPAVF